MRPKTTIRATNPRRLRRGRLGNCSAPTNGTRMRRECLNEFKLYNAGGRFLQHAPTYFDAPANVSVGPEVTRREQRRRSNSFSYQPLTFFNHLLSSWVQGSRCSRRPGSGLMTSVTNLYLSLREFCDSSQPRLHLCYGHLYALEILAC